MSRIAMGLNAPVFCSTAGVWADPPQSNLVVSVGAILMNVGIGATQKTSAHVSNPFFPSRVSAWLTAAKEAWFRIPQLAPSEGLKATGTPWVSSKTVSIAPAAPHTIWKSAARTTLASAPSMMRPGEFGIVLYAWMFAIVTPAIWPAVRVMSGTLLPEAHPPEEGAQLPPFGLAVFSFAPPVHQRGPLCAELAGLELASPRPNDVSRHVPGVDSVTLPNNANDGFPPKRADFAESIAVASKGVEFVTS